MPKNKTSEVPKKESSEYEFHCPVPACGQVCSKDVPYRQHLREIHNLVPPHEVTESKVFQCISCQKWLPGVNNVNRRYKDADAHDCAKTNSSKWEALAVMYDKVQKWDLWCHENQYGFPSSKVKKLRRSPGEDDTAWERRYRRWAVAQDAKQGERKRNSPSQTQPLPVAGTVDGTFSNAGDMMQGFQNGAPSAATLTGPTPGYGISSQFGVTDQDMGAFYPPSGQQNTSTFASFSGLGYDPALQVNAGGMAHNYGYGMEGAGGYVPPQGTLAQQHQSVAAYAGFPPGPAVPASYPLGAMTQTQVFNVNAPVEGGDIFNGVPPSTAFPVWPPATGDFGDQHWGNGFGGMSGLEQPDQGPHFVSGGLPVGLGNGSGRQPYPQTMPAPTQAQQPGPLEVQEALAPNMTDQASGVDTVGSDAPTEEYMAWCRDALEDPRFWDFVDVSHPRTN